jgi:NAD(P)-dependent dehydrogenase (short-subunit alcohol dehydrogenase family)
MAFKFEGKIAVITGGSTGMGLATAKRFVEEGMDHVFIIDRRRDSLDAAVAEIGKNVTAVQGDVSVWQTLTVYMTPCENEIARSTCSSRMPGSLSWPISER